MFLHSHSYYNFKIHHQNQPQQIKILQDQKRAIQAMAMKRMVLDRNMKIKKGSKFGVSPPNPHTSASFHQPWTMLEHLSLIQPKPLLMDSFIRPSTAYTLYPATLFRRFISWSLSPHRLDDELFFPAFALAGDGWVVEDHAYDWAELKDLPETISNLRSVAMGRKEREGQVLVCLFTVGFFNYF